MGHQDYQFVAQRFLDAISEYAIRNSGVNCAQRVVKQVDVGIGVDRTGQTDAGFLAARDVDAPLADHCVSALGKGGHVFLKLGNLNRVVEAGFVVFEAKGDIIFDC